MPRLFFHIVTLVLAIVCINSCKKPKVTKQATHDFTQTYSIYENKIYKYSTAVQLIGANAFHSFGAGGSDMMAWKMDIAREFVGNMRDNPISGNVIQDVNGSYLHSLQAVVDSNRLHGRITILCPFGWDGAATTMFTGKRPTQTPFFNAYKIKLAEWATHFKNQPDVWLEVWNEPYRYDRADGYTDAIWSSDMNELTTVIRNTGNKNIILIPCAEQGQDESVLLNVGEAFLQNKQNILFDIHAYEKWLLSTNTNISSRLQALQQKKLPILFGETAPINAGVLMQPQTFLDSTYNKGFSICAWVWKYDGNDINALLDGNGNTNNNSNNNWGNSYKAVAARVRRP